MASSRPKTYLWLGLRDSLPMIFVIAPFAVGYGVLASEAGLSTGQTMGFSVVVIAGASQLAALQLMTESAPIFVVIATALAVNLRMAMYSAALTPHLGFAPLWQRCIIAYFNVDHTYALSVARYEMQPPLSNGEKLAYFFGTTGPIMPFWFGGTLAGILMGQLIPDGFELEHAIPIAFLAMVSLMLRNTAHWSAAAVSVVTALSFADLPLNSGLLLAAMSAMAVGALVETLSENRT